MRRKAQLQMSETIFVVFIILIIILLGFVVYSKFQETSIKEQQKSFRNKRVVEMAHRLSSWPELECSVAETTEFVCLDVTKLEVLGYFINKSKQENTYAFNYYFNLLKNSKITIIEVYPSSTEWMLYNNSGKTQTADRVPIPVSLYNPLTKNYAFGIMELVIYE